MPKDYSQWTAFKALSKAALRSIAKSPSSIIFTIAFPLVFILVFGFFGDNNFNAIPIAFSKNTDQNIPLVQSLKNDKSIKIVDGNNNAVLHKLLITGKIATILDVHHNTDNTVSLQMSAASSKKEDVERVKEKINNEIIATSPHIQAALEKKITINETIIQSRSAKMIDFILPGQLGFSLLAASVFGTAFVFYNLRQTLVLKRFFATPVKKINILLAEGVARMSFQLAGGLLIILIGHFFLGFTLADGFFTVINMMILCAIGLLIFMSFGFIISGIAKAETLIPPLSNIITLPQFLLAGTFFSVSNFPRWLQPVSYAMPLTYFNDAMRKVATDGASLWSVRFDVSILLLWGIVGYCVAARVFRWE